MYDAGLNSSEYCIILQLIFSKFNFEIVRLFRSCHLQWNFILLSVRFIQTTACYILLFIRHGINKVFYRLWIVSQSVCVTFTQFRCAYALVRSTTYYEIVPLDSIFYLIK